MGATEVIKYTFVEDKIMDQRAQVLVSTISPVEENLFLAHVRRSALKLVDIGLGEAIPLELYSSGTTIWQCPNCSPFAMNKDGLIL